MRALSDERRVRRVFARLLLPGAALVRIVTTFPFDSSAAGHARAAQPVASSVGTAIRFAPRNCTSPSAPASRSSQLLTATRGQDAECLPVLSYCTPGDID